MQYGHYENCITQEHTSNETSPATANRIKDVSRASGALKMTMTKLIMMMMTTTMIQSNGLSVFVTIK